MAVRRRWLTPGLFAAALVLVAVAVVLSRLLGAGPITITTSNIRAVTSEPGIEWQPALSPDGSQVAFVARRSGRQSVVIRSTRSTATSGEIAPTQGPQGSMEIAGLSLFSVGRDRLHVTVGQYEVDMWVMDVDVAR